MDTNNGDDPVIDWQQEAAIYQDALERALDYQHTLEETISQFQQTTEKQQAQINTLKAITEKQQAQINTLKATSKKQQTQINTLKEKITLKDTSLQTNYKQYGDLQARMKELEADHLERARLVHSQYETIKTQEHVIKIQQKTLRQQREDSSQS